MEYTVHRLLAMIKTTKARIERELDSEENSVSWVRVARGQEENISGVSEVPQFVKQFLTIK